MRRAHLVGTQREKAESMGATCSKCPLRDSGPCVFGEGPANAQIAIVGEGPGTKEVEAGRPFIGASGSELEGLLQRIGLARTQVYITNATLHFPPGGDLEAFEKKCKKEAKEEGTEDVYVSAVDACRPRLFAELRIRTCRTCEKYELGPKDLRCLCERPVFVQRGAPPPQVIVPVGNFAMESLLGFSGIGNYRGSIVDVDQWRRTGDLFAPVKTLSSEQFLARMGKR